MKKALVLSLVFIAVLSFSGFAGFPIIGLRADTDSQVNDLFDFPEVTFGGQVTWENSVLDVTFIVTAYKEDFLLDFLDFTLAGVYFPEFQILFSGEAFGVSLGVAFPFEAERIVQGGDPFWSVHGAGDPLGSVGLIFNTPGFPGRVYTTAYFEVGTTITDIAWLAVGVELDLWRLIVSPAAE